MSGSEEIRELSSVFQSSTKPFHCIHCSFQSNDKLILIQHVFEAHGFINDGSFFYTCIVPSCHHRFKFGSMYSGFLSHCIRKHPGWREALSYDDSHSRCSSSSSSGSRNEVPDVFSDEDMVIEDLDYINESTDNHSCSMDERSVNIDIMGAQFLLNLKEKYKVT